VKVSFCLAFRATETWPGCASPSRDSGQLDFHLLTEKAENELMPRLTGTGLWYLKNGVRPMHSLFVRGWLNSARCCGS
jgi:hypothetical protein